MFAENLKSLRRIHGLTQAQLASEIGTSQGAIYFWEKGINTPSFAYLKKMSIIFNITVEELIDDNENTSIALLSSLNLRSLTEIDRLIIDKLPQMSISQKRIILSVINTILENKSQDNEK